MVHVQDKLIPRNFSPVYFCPKCKRPHKTVEAARECDASDEAPVCKVGEIVRVDIGYGWYDGDPKWMLLNQGFEFHGTKTHSAYFVITAIDYERDGYAPHTPRYHLKTLGIKNGNPTGLMGWTRPETHCELIRVPQDPVLVEEGAKFIGQKTAHLL